MRGHMLELRNAPIVATILALWLGVACVAPAAAAETFTVAFRVTLEPARHGASVTLAVDHGELLKRLDFANADGLISAIEGNGSVTEHDGRVYWVPPKGPATLSWFVPITHERSPGRFDAIINEEWALFRGDDVVPAMNTGEAEGTYSVTTLELVLPEGWKTARTGWPRQAGTTFRIDNPERRFDRPTGWMIAGRVGTRSTVRAGTSITVAAPMGQHFRRMEVLTFLRFVWREVREAFERTPPRLLVVGAADPLWRGGLSASNSVFLHAERPLVSENGTSPLLHELIHLVTRLSGVVTATTNDDWIAEGLAEYYSFELLYRAHGISKSRRDKILQWLSDWSTDVGHLRQGRSSGPITARAVVLLEQLDQEIRRRSGDKHSLDDVTRRLMAIRTVSLADLRRVTADLIGNDITTLDSAVLR